MGSEHGGGAGLCDTRLLIRGESGPLSSSSYHHQGAAAAAAAAAYQHYNKPTGASLCGGAAATQGGGMNVAESMGTAQCLHSSMISAGRAPFTSVQWAELEHQALIFKYMMAGVNVPPELLNPIRKSVASLINGMTASHHAANMRWGTMHRGVANNTDPEPGRCRRTDGKKWRCGRDVVPDQKYCERHVHRGRNRSRKHAADGGGQAGGASTSSGGNTTTATTTSSTSSGGGGSSGITNVGPIRGGGTSSSCTPTGSSSTFSLSSFQRPSNLSVKSFSSSHSASPAGGSSPAASSQFGQLPPGSLASSPSAGGGGGASTHLTNKDYRYFQGSMMKSEQGIHGSEQMLSSDGSTLRGGGGGVPGGQDSSSSQMLSNLSRLPSMNQSWHSAMTSKVGQAPGDSAKVQNNSNNSSSSLLHYHSPQMRGLLGQDFGLLPETSQVDHVTHGMSQQHQQHQQHQQQAYHVSNAYGGGGHGAESVSHVGRESEGQPLRHFFDDWPRASRDQSAMTWGSSGVDESERSNSDNNNNNLTINTHHGAPNNNNNNNTQLSISIPITASSSAALSAQHSGSPPAGCR
ncbi:hypothetical protein BDL97_02G184500 [Sphagnum fallax]|nr:hypothetical protein BDL97_02G184500 [Sphagnum fallax]